MIGAAAAAVGAAVVLVAAGAQPTVPGHPTWDRVYAVSAFKTVGPAKDQRVWYVIFSSSVYPKAIGYKLWLDGADAGDHLRSKGATQGFKLPVACGEKHTLNVQPRTSTTAYGAKSQLIPWTAPKC